MLSRVNVEEQTFEGEKESVLKIYHLLSTRADLTTILTNMSTHQQADQKLRNLKLRLEEGDETVAIYYQMNKQIPVSYTHLDVYKRQLLYIRTIKIILSNIIPEHLYKYDYIFQK